MINNLFAIEQLFSNQKCKNVIIDIEATDKSFDIKTGSTRTTRDVYLLGSSYTANHFVCHPTQRGAESARFLSKKFWLVAKSISGSALPQLQSLQYFCERIFLLFTSKKSQLLTSYDISIKQFCLFCTELESTGDSSSRIFCIPNSWLLFGFSHFYMQKGFRWHWLQDNCVVVLLINNVWGISDRATSPFEIVWRRLHQNHIFVTIFSTHTTFPKQCVGFVLGYFL